MDGVCSVAASTAYKVPLALSVAQNQLFGARRLALETSQRRPGNWDFFRQSDESPRVPTAIALAMLLECALARAVGGGQLRRESCQTSGKLKCSHSAPFVRYCPRRISTTEGALPRSWVSRPSGGSSNGTPSASANCRILSRSTSAGVSPASFRWLEAQRSRRCSLLTIGLIAWPSSTPPRAP